MKINLSTNWFAPDGVMRRKTRNPHTVPDDWEEILPPHTVILDEPPVEKPAPKK